MSEKLHGYLLAYFIVSFPEVVIGVLAVQKVLLFRPILTHPFIEVAIVGSFTLDPEFEIKRSKGCQGHIPSRNDLREDILKHTVKRGVIDRVYVVNIGKNSE